MNKFSIYLLGSRLFNIKLFEFLSGGFIHETTTVYKVDKNAVRIIGSPNGEFSWFPGFV